MTKTIGDRAVARVEDPKGGVHYETDAIMAPLLTELLRLEFDIIGEMLPREIGSGRAGFWLGAVDDVEALLQLARDAGVPDYNRDKDHGVGPYAVTLDVR